MTKTITDILRPFLVVLFIFGFGSLTACGGGSGGGGTSVSTPVTTTVRITTGTADNPITVRVTTPAPPPMTITLETPAPPAPQITYTPTSPELGAFHFSRGDQYWFVALSVAPQGETLNILNRAITLERMRVQRNGLANQDDFPWLNRASLHAHGEIVPLVDGTRTVLMPSTIFYGVIALEKNPAITSLVQLCPASWAAAYLNNLFSRQFCPAMSQLSYSPDMRRVVHAVLADGFNRGIGIGESNFAFSGRHNGNDRAAGFTYDFDNFALRTDYVHLPSKQDSGVWLDTYRFGVMPYINDETRFFAGVDSYRNAILALDINAENLHRFGIALGDGYAVQYELRVRL